MKSEVAEKYNNFRDGVEIVNIEIRKLSLNKTGNPEEKGYKTLIFGFKNESSRYEKISTSLLGVFQDMIFTIFEMKEKDEKTKKSIFDLKVTFYLLFKTKEKIDDEIFDLFVKNDIPVKIHPYFREVVSNMLMRAGLPAITIPIYENT